MSYPQPLASQEVLEGQEFFRLFTELDSSGDVYEMDVSAKAFVIGPQSDIARVRVTYWDPILRGNSQSFVVSVDDPFLGRVDAFDTNKYPLVNTQGRILISPEDILENSWRPSNVAGVVAFQPPRIDLLAYLSPPPAVPSKRADFKQEGRLQIGASGTSSLVYPYYRRKFASVQITNFAAGTGYTVGVNGITFTTDANVPIVDGTSYRVQTTAIVAPTAIAAGAGSTTTVRVKASTSGLFDYLVINVAGPPISGAVVAPIYYTILFTDEEV